MPLEDVPGGGGRARGGSSSSNPAVLVESKGLGALAPSAEAEAECLLQSLTELAPVLEEAQALTEEVRTLSMSIPFEVVDSDRDGGGCIRFRCTLWSLPVS